MAKTRPPYPAEFREQMVALVRSGRTPSELAREFEPSAQAIGDWVRKADAEEGHSEAGLTQDEHEELRHLRKENKRLRTERESWQRQPPGSLRRPTRYRPTLRVRESASGYISDHHAL